MVARSSCCVALWLCGSVALQLCDCNNHNDNHDMSSSSRWWDQPPHIDTTSKKGFPSLPNEGAASQMTGEASLTLEFSKRVKGRQFITATGSRCRSLQSCLAVGRQPHPKQTNRKFSARPFWMTTDHSAGTCSWLPRWSRKTTRRSHDDFGKREKEGEETKKEQHPRACCVVQNLCQRNARRTKGTRQQGRGKTERKHTQTKTETNTEHSKSTAKAQQTSGTNNAHNKRPTNRGRVNLVPLVGYTHHPIYLATD